MRLAAIHCPPRGMELRPLSFAESGAKNFIMEMKLAQLILRCAVSKTRLQRSSMLNELHTKRPSPEQGVGRKKIPSCLVFSGKVFILFPAPDTGIGRGRKTR